MSTTESQAIGRLAVIYARQSHSIHLLRFSPKPVDRPGRRSLTLTKTHWKFKQAPTYGRGRLTSNNIRQFHAASNLSTKRMSAR
jgi:hypothetical protein